MLVSTKFGGHIIGDLQGKLQVEDGWNNKPLKSTHSRVSLEILIVLHRSFFVPHLPGEVGRFYQRCSSPPCPPPPPCPCPPPPPPPLLPHPLPHSLPPPPPCPPPSPPPSPLPPLHPLSYSLRLANSSPSFTPTYARSGHCWTSTWDLPRSVSTARPQPATFRAQ